MQLSELIPKLTVEVDGLSEAEALRLLERAAERLIGKFELPYRLEDGELTPDPSNRVVELIILGARLIEAERSWRKAANEAISFTSGDKRFDRTAKARQLKDLVGRLREQLTTLAERITGMPSPAVFDLTVEGDEPCWTSVNAS